MDTPSTLMSPMVRWPRAAILIASVAFLFFGVVYAQEPDFEAVGDRLIEAVEEGELTQEQATAMMGELARAAFAARLREAREDHDDEEHDDDDARMGRFRAIEREIDEAVETGRLTPREARRKLMAVKKEFFEEEDEEDEGLAGHFHEMGVSGEGLETIVEALEKSGIRGRQIEMVLGGVLRTVHEMRSEGDRYEMDPGLIRFLMGEARLEREQISLVQRIAK
ncbi:MAG: hypothetical protein ACYTFG_18490, partial [Planctomycetota bacterium]